MYKPGDIVPIKFYGKLLLFQFLDEHEKIDEHTYYQSPFNKITQKCRENYTENMAKFDPADSIFSSTCIGETPFEGHTHRIYLRRLGDKLTLDPPVRKDIFIKNYLPGSKIFTLVTSGGESLQYQYTNVNKHFMDNVLDLVKYLGYQDGYHYWISNDYLAKVA